MDRRLRAEMARVKDFLIPGEADTLNWVSGKKLLADCLSKRTASSYKHLRLFQTWKTEIKE